MLWCCHCRVYCPAETSSHAERPSSFPKLKRNLKRGKGGPHELNSLKGVINGDTRSLEHGSYAFGGL